MGIVELLLAKGADVNAKAHGGETALQVASSYGRKEIVETLLAGRANVNAKDEYGETALYAASVEGRREVVELLLANGADAKAKTNGGETALQIASKNGHKDVVHVLLGKKAKYARVQGGRDNAAKPGPPRVSDNAETAGGTSNSMPRDSAGVPSAGPKSTVEDIDSPVEKGSSITFRQLAESVFKGVHKEVGSDNLVTDSEKVLRRPGTKERTVLSAGAKLNSFEAIRVRGDGRRYIVTFWTADHAERTRRSRERRSWRFSRREARSPGTSRRCKPTCSALLAMAPDAFHGPDDAFTVSNSHHNSSQGYLDTTALPYPRRQAAKDSRGLHAQKQQYLQGFLRGATDLANGAGRRQSLPEGCRNRQVDARHLGGRWRRLSKRQGRVSQGGVLGNPALGQGKKDLRTRWQRARRTGSFQQ